MADLNTIDFAMLLTSKYQKYLDKQSEEDEQYANTMRIILNKIRYLNSVKNNTNDSLYECGAIFFTVFTAPAWVWIGCDEEFEENHYLCERKRVPTKRYKYTYIRNESWCQQTYVYAGGFCWANVNEIGKVHTPFQLLIPLNLQLESYLSAWSLGHANRKVVFVGTSGSCLSSVAFTYQRTRQWVLNNHCALAQQRHMHTLILKRLITSKVKCKPQSQYTCGDGTCIMNNYVCDGKIDCSDENDELDCDNACLKQHSNISSLSNVLATNGSCVCGVLYFQCNIGFCIPLQSRCNGIQDCVDGADELFCLLDHINKNVLNYHQRHVDYEVCTKVNNYSSVTSVFHCCIIFKMVGNNFYLPQLVFIILCIWIYAIELLSKSE